MRFVSATLLQLCLQVKARIRPRNRAQWTPTGNHCSLLSARCFSLLPAHRLSSLVASFSHSLARQLANCSPVSGPPTERKPSELGPFGRLIEQRQLAMTFGWFELALRPRTSSSTHTHTLSLLLLASSDQSVSIFSIELPPFGRPNGGHP